VNARPHLGHAYTTILADCVHRFHRLLNEETFFLTGTDEHGDKIVQAAEEHGEDPQQYVDKISTIFRDLWPQLDVEPDYFVRTTQQEHKDCVQRFLQLVYDAGDIYYGEYGGYYCYGCECFYQERELENGLCPDHRKAPQFIREENYFFRMSRYQDWLRDHITENPDFIQPWQFRNEVLALLREPLDDLCISRPKRRLTWGIELPFDSRFVTYVWFDALINYISALGWPDGEPFRTFWPNSHHIVAKDILKPHAIFWPIMLKSAGVQQYRALRVHGYWKVDEAKMSKSLGNVVDPMQMRQTYGIDAFRYFLMREMHLGHDGSFSEQALLSRFNADLANDLGNLFNRTLAMTHKYFQGKVPEVGRKREEDEELESFGLAALREYMGHFREFRVAQGLEHLWELLRGLNKYIDQTAPWSLNKAGETERLATVMGMAAGGLRKAALALWPVMPRAAGQMLAQLDLEMRPEETDLEREARSWAEDEVRGAKVAKKSNLFPRKEGKTFKEGQEESAPRERAAASSGEEGAGTLDLKEFQKMDLRVGEVTRAEPHPNADKLLKLEVEVGTGRKRQIVAGLAGHYDPADLVGRRVVVVGNLKPSKLRGELSEGMVLAAHDEDGLRLIGPDGQARPGSKVS
jgi:methionyl-tRNA synthetase